MLEKLNYRECVLEKSDYFDKRSDDQQLHSMKAAKDSMSQGGRSMLDQNKSDGVSPTIHSQLDSVHTEPL